MITTRFCKREDFGPLCAAEDAFHATKLSFPEAPLFGVAKVSPPWSWRPDHILSAVRRYKSKKTGEFDTRAIVAQLTHKILDSKTGKLEELAETVGGIIYETADDSYEILLLTVNPNKLGGVPLEAVLDTLLERVLRKAENSERRTRVRFHIPDGSYRLLKFFQDKKVSGEATWPYKRVDSYFADGSDAWLVEYQAAVTAEEEHEVGA